MDGMTFGALPASPDKRDYRAEEVLGDAQIELPKEHRIGRINYKNQGRSVACTAFAAHHVLELMNEKEHNKNIESDPMKGWERQKKLGTHIPGVGDYIVTALKSVVKNGMSNTENKKYPVSGYALVSRGWDLDPDKIKRFLARGYALETSCKVTKTNFKNAKKTGFLTGNKDRAVAFHAFCLTGYTERGFVAANSYGPTWGAFNNGEFIIPYSELKHLSTMYAIYDEKDIQPIPEWGQSAVDKCIKLGWKDWTNPWETIGGKKLVFIHKDFGGVSKVEESMSAIKYAVALDKEGVLDYLLAKQNG